jgi:uncharacterized protein involved in outer membrane biogenesis
MRKLLLGILALILVVAIGAILVARGVIGNDTIRRTLEQQLSASLGQPVTIGRLGATFVPRVALDLHDITIGQPAGATIADLSIATGLRGLLSKRVEDAEVIVSNSRIPVDVAVGIAGGIASAPSSTSGGGVTIVSVRTLAFRHVEVVAEPRSLLVDLESSVTGDRLDVTRLSAQSAGTHLEAKGTVASVAKRQATFTATATQLNLDELLGLASALSSPVPATGPASPSSPASPPTPTSAAPAAPPALPSAAAPASADAPLDITLDFTAPGGQVAGYTFSDLSATLHVTNSTMALKPVQFGLFGGTCSGQVTIDTSGAVPSARLDGTIKGMDMLTLLRETRGSTSLTGKLTANLALGTRGSTTDALFGAARGTGRVTIVNGTVPGLDMVRSVVLAFGKPSGSPPAGTGSGFSKIDGTFSLADGTLHSDDVSFASRDFDMSGAPTIRFPGGTIDMRANVVLSRELTEQAGTDLRRFAQEDGRIVGPAVLGGTVASPTVNVDVQAALSRALQNEMKRRVKGLFDRIIR